MGDERTATGDRSPTDDRSPTVADRRSPTVADRRSMTNELIVAAERSGAGDALTGLVVKTSRLNGLFLDAAESIARPVGLTAAWWQVLGAVLDQPRSVAGIAREMGLARQSVQRVADLLAERGLVEYRPNPAHRRAKLVAPTRAGWVAIESLAGTQHEWANRISATVGESDLRKTVGVVDALIAACS